MIRDPILPSRSPRQLSRQATSKFFYFVDAIAKDQEPAETQLAALERIYKSMGESLLACPELREYLDLVHAQGSRQIGTLIRPAHVRAEGFDIDLVVRLRKNAWLRYGGQNGATLLLDHLYSALSRYATQHGLEIERWERCVTLKYKDGIHADVAVVIEDSLVGIPYGDTHARIPDRKLHLYDPTNPMGLAASFNLAAKISPLFISTEMLTEDRTFSQADLVPLPNADEVFSRLLCRLVQLIKINRNITFGAPSNGQDFAPKSVFITALATAAYTHQARVLHQGPLDLLLDIVDTMPLYFQRQTQSEGREFWMLENPAAPGDNLASGMNTHAHQQAFNQWHSRLKDYLERLVDSIERREGFDVTYPLIEKLFGSRAANVVRNLNVPKTPPANSSRSVIYGTAATAAVFSTSARGHNFHGR